MPSLFEQAKQQTDQVASRIDAKLAEWPLIQWLMDHFSGLVYWAAQRLLDRQQNTGDYRPRDHAIIESCPRLFSDSFAGYQLARQGLILQSAVLLRSAFEVTTQMILFLEREDVAEKWVKGEKIRPKDVRELTSMPETERELYKRLSDLAHPNYEALWHSSVPVPGPGTMGKASVYGGWYAPKQAGQLAIQFLWAQLVFLEKFWQMYEDDLREQGLLWRKETIELAGREPLEDFGWLTYLALMRDILTKLTNEHNEKTPEDGLDVAMALSPYTPEEKERWRKAVEDRIAEFKTQTHNETASPGT